MKGVSELTPAQAVAWINDPNTVVVDISPAAEFNKGHIVDAKHIQAKRLSDPDAEMQKLQDKRVLLVCKSGQAAMSSASQIRSLGVQDVAVLKGGMAQWRQDQFPVTTS